MFGDQPITFTLVANAAVTERGTVVVQSGTSGRSMRGATATSAASGFMLVGVALNEPAAGEALSVAGFGLVRCVAGGAVAQGVRVTTNSVGRLTAAVSGDHFVGYAREAANANGDTFECFIAALGDRMQA